MDIGLCDIDPHLSAERAVVVFSPFGKAGEVVMRHVDIHAAIPFGAPWFFDGGLGFLAETVATGFLICLCHSNLLHRNAHQITDFQVIGFIGIDFDLFA